MKIFITGTAGFIGYHLTKKLSDGEHDIIGLDVINDYYDINLKFNRLDDLGFHRKELEVEGYKKYKTHPERNPGLESRGSRRVQSKKYKKSAFVRMDLANKEALDSLFKKEKFDIVINLAAQAGVRYSLTNPQAYIDSNIQGFINILEACRHNKVQHLVYASSSSVYGLNETMPFSVHHNVDHPVSLYAASKKSNELMAHTYSHLYGLPTTGLRFFTVYGPWGRPDMALFIFTKAILEGNPIDVFNNGHMQRDFTYVDDIVEGITRVAMNTPKGNPKWTGKQPDPGTSPAPYKIYNIGNNSPVKLMDFIDAIEKAIGKKAVKNMMPIQPGDVPATWAEVQDLIDDVGYKPATPIEEGIRRFVAWYRGYYRV